MVSFLEILCFSVGYSSFTTYCFLSKLGYSLYYNEYQFWYGTKIITLFKNSRYDVFCYSANKRLCDINEKRCDIDENGYYKDTRLVPEEYECNDFHLYPANFISRFAIKGEIKNAKNNG